jgi:hypothetical protein
VKTRYLLASFENRVTARQIGKMRSLQSEKRSVQNDKCGRCKSREDSPPKTQRFPEYVPIAERAEPESIHVIRKCGPTAEEDDGKNNENQEKETAKTTRRLQLRPWPVSGLAYQPTR